MALLYVMYQPEAVCENKHCKILWIFTRVTDLSLRRDRPDITYVLKDKQEVVLIDITVPGDCRIAHIGEMGEVCGSKDSDWQVLEVSHFHCPYYFWSTGFYPKESSF